jgi:predicted nucleotidyltransferase
MSRLVQQLIALLEALRRQGVRHAAIGGLAVVAHGVVRATQDLDFLIDAGARTDLDRVMSDLGFQCIHSSEDAANYASEAFRIDFLFARREPTRRLLAGARTLRVFGHELAVVDVEGIIGLKLQALVNDPRRQQDLVDIRALLSAHRKSIDLARLREYFALFEREAMLEQLLAEAEREAT